MKSELMATSDVEDCFPHHGGSNPLILALRTAFDPKNMCDYIGFVLHLPGE